MGTFVALEVPPGKAVLYVKQQGPFSKEGGEARGNLGDVMRLQGQDHEILGGNLVETVRGQERPDHALFAILHDDPEAAAPDGLQVLAHVHQRKIGSRPGKAGTHQPANSPGAYDTHLHPFTPVSGSSCFGGAACRGVTHHKKPSILQGLARQSAHG
jgi:hypothetical protein